MEGGVSVKTECDVKRLEPLTGSEKPARQLDIRRAHASKKQAAISAAGGGLTHTLVAGSQLEHPKLAAASEMVKLRGRHVGDCTANCLYLEPAAAEVLWRLRRQ